MSASFKSRNFHGTPENFTEKNGLKWKRPRISSRSAPFIIERIRPIGTTFAMTKYLREAGLWLLAQFKLEEVHYQIQYSSYQFTKYCALGWQNENGGWQLRNERWQGCLGRRGVSLIPGHPERLAVFEDYFHYLHCLDTMDSRTYTVLILNELCFLTAACYYAGYYSHVDLFLPNTREGRKATKAFIKTVPYATDCCGIYEEHPVLKKMFSHALFITK